MLRDGRIEQVGTPDEIYSAPTSDYVFDFIGRANVLDGRVDNGRFRIAGHALALPVEGVADGAARLYARPHDIEPVPPAEGIAAHVVAAHRLADRITLEAQMPGQARALEIDSVSSPGAGTVATGTEIVCNPVRYRVFPA